MQFDQKRKSLLADKMIRLLEFLSVNLVQVSAKTSAVLDASARADAHDFPI